MVLFLCGVAFRHPEGSAMLWHGSLTSSLSILKKGFKFAGLPADLKSGKSCILFFKFMEFSRYFGNWAVKTRNVFKKDKRRRIKKEENITQARLSTCT